MPYSASDNWGYPTGEEKRRSDPTARPGTQPDLGSKRRNSVGRRAIRMLRAVFVTSSLVAIGGFAFAEFKLEEPARRLLERVVELTDPGSNQATPSSLDNMPRQLKAIASRERVWNCGGVFTDAPGPNDICFSVDSAASKDERGNKYIGPAW